LDEGPLHHVRGEKHDPETGGHRSIPALDRFCAPGDDRLKRETLLDTRKTKLDFELGVLGKNELRRDERSGVIEIEDPANGIDALAHEPRVHQVLDGNPRVASAVSGIHGEARMQVTFPAVDEVARL
jgi:hypothetical protein